MKIETTVSELLNPVKSASMAVARKQTLPVLTCLLVFTNEEGTWITGTNLQHTIVSGSPIVATVPGSYALPAFRLREILQSLPDDGQIKLEVESVLNDSRKATLRCGRSRFLLNVFDGADFPSPPKIDPVISFTVSQQELKTALDRTAYAMAKDDVRYYLKGMLLQCGTQIMVVATDGHRLAVNNLRGFEYELTANEPHEVIIPIDAVEALRKQLSDTDTPVTVQITDRSISVDFGDTRIIAQLVEGKFPDYQRVVPRETDKVVIADRMLIRSALSRAAIVLNDKTSGVRLSFEDWLLRVNTRNSDQEEADEEVEINYTGGPIELGFNVRYLLATLDALDCHMIKLSLTDSASSILIEDAESGSGKHVIMPMRL